MKPWREIAVPHPDVLEGTFQQSEFAADLTAVHTGKAGREYQDAAAFFERTYITEGMRLLLLQVAERLSGKGGEPVIQLQTAFGGGKTHTLLAVYHLATRKAPLKELAGIPELMDRAGLMDLPQAKVAVLDGVNRAPNQPLKQGKQKIHTLWGDLAWQLGGEEAYALVADSDASGTSPGKEILRDLLEKNAPCVVLLDELVVYMRQFPAGQQLSGGSFESNLSFLQSLTEAAKLVPNAVILASLPESDNQAGGSQGVVALKALEELFNRVQAIWKTVGKEESFEIVRRRLFEPITHLTARDQVCRAFADAYNGEGGALPAETRESRYYERLQHAYPVHPEVFERLYEDWTTIPGFQRTRGVLKLMAKVIHRLWKDQNTDLMILPGSLPLYDGGGCRAELIYHLGPGWDPVIDRDIDGPDAETVGLENKEPRFGAVNAARRVARTLFLGSAPSSIATVTGNRGIDRGRVLLGCVQPGQTAALYNDAINRLSDRLHYLNASGDKNESATRFWFDTRANLRREMEDRKARFKEETEVRGRMAEVVKKMTSNISCVDGIHVFTPHGDVPDDGALRLVILAPERFYSKQETKRAFEEIETFLKQNGTKPRYRQNRLLFLAPEHGSLLRMSDCIRIALAWRSIVDDVKTGRLNIDQAQLRQAEKEASTAEDVLPRAARECFKWLLCPMMLSPTDPKAMIEAFPLNTAGSTCGAEIERVCQENELVIQTWSPVHLRDTVLRKLYWKPDRTSVRALDVWEDMQRHIYLPRLRSRASYEKTIATGAGSRDFFGTANGEHEGKFDGFRLGDSQVQLDETLLLIEPGAAAAYEEAHRAPALVTPISSTSSSTEEFTPSSKVGEPVPVYPNPQPAPAVTTTRYFSGSTEVNASMAKVKLAELADEIIRVLANDPTATVRVSVEIEAEFQDGATDATKRAVSENAKQLKMKRAEWS
jgi:predicted AAA+ superfamily ATPase